MSNMMHDESMTTATTAKLMPQHGGKYADHEFVKVASKVIKGVERAPYNQFETILVSYDKMKEIKGKRKLTKTEQRIYDKADKLIQKEFDAMFKKADTMLDQLDRKTTAQKGGSLFSNKVAPAAATSDAPVKDTSLFGRFKIKKNSVSPAPAADAAATPDPVAGKDGPPATPAKEGSATPDATPVKGPTDAASTPAASPPTSSAPTNATPVKDASSAPNAGAEVPAATEEVPPATKELPPRKPFHPREDEYNGDDTPAAAAAAPDPAAPATPAPAATPKGADNETSFMDSNRFYRWVVSLLKGIWEWIKGLFTGAFSDKFEQLRKQFSADELFKLFGNDHNKMDAATEALRVQAEKIQRLVATGIGGAASASIDMILNAFSMSPVFGTTILVWRMFQNMLMIMGASLSVQAASNSGATTLATIADPEEAKKKAGQGGGKAKNNVTKRLKTDIRQLNRSLKRYMHFPHHRKGTTGTTMNRAGSGYSYT